jgi:hypothetical protein
MKRARELYEKREAEYPVDFAMDLTMMLMRQNPQVAAGQLVSWANRRMGLSWTLDHLRSNPPAKVREQLIDASREAIKNGTLAKAVEEAKGFKEDDALDAHLRDKYGVNLPEWMRNLEGEEREDAIRARVESNVRAELVQFEQTILIHTLDDLWRGHLYGMDVLRDNINFRAYAQEDPRIAFKREGAKQFTQMMESVRDRLTDDIFRVKLTPVPQQSAMPTQAPPQQRFAPPPPPAQPPGPFNPPSGATPSQIPGLSPSTISGPGLDPLAAAAEPGWTVGVPRSDRVPGSVSPRHPYKTQSGPPDMLRADVCNAPRTRRHRCFIPFIAPERGPVHSRCWNCSS